MKRRDFFKILKGKKSADFVDKCSKKKIALNRLNELPAHIIEEIIPVLFPKTEWHISGAEIVCNGSNPETAHTLILDTTEFEVFQLFGHSKNLKNIASVIVEKNKKEYNEVFSLVCALFFKLASLRICHPLQVYDIDALRLDKKSNSVRF